MKISIITSGFLPVPASKGGAVENLIDNFIEENEKNNNNILKIYTCYDKKAEEMSRTKKNAKYVFIKDNFLVKVVDNTIFFIAKRILRKKNSHSYRYIFKRLYFLWKVSKLLKKDDSDKILLENHASMYLALKWNRNYIKYKDNIYYHCHNLFDNYYGCKKIVDLTKKFISVSEFRSNQCKNFLKLDNEKFSVVKNGINQKKITKIATDEEIEKIRKKYNISSDETIFLYTGRIVPGKGVKEIIEATKIIKNEKFKILLLGSSLNSLNVKNKFEEDLLNLIDDSIADKIIFTGFVNYEELYKFYTIADVALLPSIMEDSAPLTVIESVSCGLPIITTDSGGIPEYVNKNCAFILKRDSKIIDNIALSMKTLITDKNLKNKMSDESKKISKKYDTKNCYENMIKELEG